MIGADQAVELLLADIVAAQMVNRDFMIVVRPQMFGQLRVLVCSADAAAPGAEDGVGPILRVLCTYSLEKALQVTKELQAAEDPLAAADAYRRPWNDEGGRIRLDNKPSPEMSLVAIDELRDRRSRRRKRALRSRRRP